MAPVRSLLIADFAVPVVAFAVVVIGGSMHSDAAITSPGGALGTALASALGARRRAPVATVAVTLALVGVLAVVDRAYVPYAMLVPAAALLSLALSGSRTRQWVGGLGGLGLVVGAEFANHHRPGVFASFQHLALLAAAVLAAEMLRTRRSYRSVLVERRALLSQTRDQEAKRLVQEERLRIARDLHDVLAHTLTTINVQAAVAGHLMDSRPEHARQALHAIEETSREAIAEVRGIVGVLRDSDGPVAPPLAPAPGLDDVAGLVELACDAGVHARLQVHGTRPDRVPEAVSRAAFRIVQESLTNAARHSVGADVRVELSYEPEQLAIAVENAVCEERSPSASLGVGIVGMTERAEALGGSLRTTASDGAFLVAASLPYPRT